MAKVKCMHCINIKRDSKYCQKYSKNVKLNKPRKCNSFKADNKFLAEDLLGNIIKHTKLKMSRLLEQIELFKNEISTLEKSLIILGEKPSDEDEACKWRMKKGQLEFAIETFKDKIKSYKKVNDELAVNLSKKIEEVSKNIKDGKYGKID